MKVLYFASLREALGRASEEIGLPQGVTTIGALRVHLAARGEADIDEALSHNKGYQEYREAVGK